MPLAAFRSRSAFVLLSGIAVLGVACASGGRDANRIEMNQPAPDWLATGGKTPRYQKAYYVTGFSMVEMEPGQGGLDAAKQQAAASLSRNISVRIQASLRDVTESKDGADSYQIASIVNATSDIQLSGLDYEVYPQPGRSYALAYLHRGNAIAERRSLRERSLTQVRECLASGGRHEEAGREADAIATYEGCRGPIAEALEHDSVARVLGPEASLDGSVYAELVAAKGAVDEKVRTIMRRPASSLSEAIERLAIQLQRQKAIGSGRTTVSPLTYGTTDLSSVFGRQASVELESLLARGGTRGVEGNRVVRGVYLERDAEIRITATVRDAESGQLVASAESTLPRSALPSGLSLKPANFESALKSQKILGQGELSSGDLQLEVWTDRGRRGVVYTESEELSLLYRVNQPAWVRFVYVLQGGQQVPIGDAWYIDASKVNQVITYPERFEIVPPFGVEHVHATAFAQKPAPLVTEPRVIAGESYTVVSDALRQLTGIRGIKRKRGEAMSEALVTVTTMPR